MLRAGTVRTLFITEVLLPHPVGQMGRSNNTSLTNKLCTVPTLKVVFAVMMRVDKGEQDGPFSTLFSQI